MALIAPAGTRISGKALARPKRAGKRVPQGLNSLRENRKKQQTLEAGLT
jgi:hypothetical protein